MKIIKIFGVVAILVISVAFVFYQFISTSNEDELLPITDKSIIDMHVHVAGLGYGNSGCFVSEDMRSNFRFPFYLKAMGVNEDILKEKGDRVLFELISQSVFESKSVGKAVILALDGVVTDGEINKALTQVYIPNDYVATETAKFDNLLFGASINPYRPDAVNRLETAHKQGAVLVKWIPSIMDIDPADKAITEFYKKMVELDIPLLTHTGMEKSFSTAKDELADPRRLELPLSLGVTVIAAHIATTGQSEGQDNFLRILPMFKQYPNLYADISSLTQINKLGYLKKALEIEGLSERFVYGTDWPLQFFPLISSWYHLDLISPSEAKSVQKIDNQWDRDVALKDAMGVDEAVFYRTDQLLLGGR